MYIEFKPASPHCTAEYIRLRGLTRENAVSEERLRELGITAASWASDIQSGQLQGIAAFSKDEVIGYCFGNSNSGEVVVLAVLPAFEGQGVGKRLLLLVVELLHAHGQTKLFLGCSSDPAVRSYGFYRYLGWRSAGTIDAHGDEVLRGVPPSELFWPAGQRGLSLPLSGLAPAGRLSHKQLPGTTLNCSLKRQSFTVAPAFCDAVVSSRRCACNQAIVNIWEQNYE